MKPKKQCMKLLAPLAGLLLGAGQAQAADIFLSGDTFVVSSVIGSNVTLTVSGPDGFTFTDDNGVVTRNTGLGGTQGGGLADGSYSYEIKEYSYGGQQTVNDPSNGRVGVVRKIVTSATVRSGTVTVQNGAVVDFPDIQETSN